MLGADRTVTVVHYDGGEYQCSIIEGVSVHQELKHIVSDKGVVAQMVATVRIPEDVLPKRLPEGSFQ